MQSSASTPAMAHADRRLSFRNLVLAIAILSGTFLILSNTLNPFRPHKSEDVSALRDHITKFTAADLQVTFTEGDVTGHADFDDGRKRSCPRAFAEPESEGLSWVNVMMGNGG